MIIITMSFLYFRSIVLFAMVASCLFTFVELYVRLDRKRERERERLNPRQDSQKRVTTIRANPEGLRSRQTNGNR